MWSNIYRKAGFFADIYFLEFREFLLVTKIFFAKFWVPRLLRVARAHVGVVWIWPNRENIFREIRSLSIRENIGPRKKPAMRYTTCDKI